MRIAFITNVPSPYRVNFFNELGKYCDLTVFFEKKSSDERDKSWELNNFLNFKGVFLKGIKFDVDKAISFEICKYLSKNSFDHIIVSNVATPTGIIAITHMRARKIPYWIEGDGGFAKKGSGFKEWLKRFLMKNTVGCFSTSKEHDNYYVTYGVSTEKIYRYPFTALFEDEIIDKPLTPEEKRIIRKEIGVSEDKFILAVGQFIHRKGFDLLLHAAENLPKDIGIYFIGGKPTEEYVTLKKVSGLYNVHFISFTEKELLKKWYSAAEIFVLPTREDIWGLVVNEAMAEGLPIITTDRCIAGLELVENGVNGYIIPTESVKPLVEKIENILGDSQLSTVMSYNSLKKIKQYTIENMVKVHIEILKKYSGEN